MVRVGVRVGVGVRVSDADLHRLATQQGDRRPAGGVGRPRLAPAVRGRLHGGLDVGQLCVGHGEHRLGGAQLAVTLDAEAARRPLGVGQRKGLQ
eukprot:scaffold18107_cov57-Phaeocystis_antarctica.AAC.1